MSNIKIVKLSYSMYKYYKENVKGNENITKAQAERKMTRNLHLAAKLDSKGYENQMYQYGGLRFLVTPEGKIVWMRNKCKPVKGWKKNKAEYVRLTKELGIEDGHTYLELVADEMKYKAKRTLHKLKRKIG